MREELARFIDCHIKYIVDTLAFVFHFQRLTVVALALAYIARNVNVGQKVHLDFNNTITTARLTSATGNVE